MIYGSKSRVKLHDLTFRLWDTELLQEKGLRLAQQLVMQSVMIILLKGEAVLELEDRAIRMGEGSAYICPGGKTFGLTGYGTEPASIAVFNFSVYQAHSLHKGRLLAIEDPSIFLEEGAALSSVEKTQSICRTIYKHFHHAQEMIRWRAQLDFQEFLYELIQESGLDSKNDKSQALERAKTFMEEHYSEDLTVEQLAGIADFSSSYFAEIFKRTYGCSVVDYLAQIRMNKAKQLMLGSDVLLKEIAHLVGYKDEFYFSRKFKKEFGLSPSAYMKKEKNKIALYGSTSLLGYLIPLHIIPYAAPLHPKWSAEQYHTLGPEIPVHLDAYRQNHNKEANLDKLETAQPERIICTQELEPWEKERLARIAPIYEMPLETGSWEEELRDLAKWLNRTEEAEQWLQSFSRKMKLLQRHIAPYLQQSALVCARVCQNQLRLNNSRAIKEVLGEQLGCRISTLSPGLSDFAPLTVGDLRRTEADHILILVRQDSETLAYWRRLSSSPEWLSLRAVKEGKLHMIPSYPWREFSPVAIEQMAESAARFLTGKNP
ncbi:AraC family transcriptional regulator [Paenibacillus sp. HJL G12]|uniref:AraC family transcriptional regulator n=1 Tax=Paenibacillus dendrobii TaxID=2691084 RepID=A0A7X3ILW4_9BACL|nr:AraC family transcriptional regulator [Paenibacillus dendrobii]MWV44432.1 AraC family transcriptional regulator [Paenibacillus dendrobii]